MQAPVENTSHDLRASAAAALLLLLLLLYTLASSASHSLPSPPSPRWCITSFFIDCRRGTIALSRFRTTRVVRFVFSQLRLHSLVSPTLRRQSFHSLPSPTSLTMSGNNRRPPCTQCVTTQETDGCPLHRCAACCKRLGGCVRHVTPRRSARRSGAAPLLPLQQEEPSNAVLSDQVPPPADDDDEAPNPPQGAAADPADAQQEAQPRAPAGPAQPAVLPAAGGGDHSLRVVIPMSYVNNHNNDNLLESASSADRSMPASYPPPHPPAFDIMAVITRLDHQLGVITAALRAAPAAPALLAAAPPPPGSGAASPQLLVAASPPAISAAAAPQQYSAAPPLAGVAALPQMFSAAPPPLRQAAAGLARYEAPLPPSHLDRYPQPADDVSLSAALRLLEGAEVNPSAHIPAPHQGGFSVRQGDIRPISMRDIIQIGSITPPATPPATTAPPSEFDSLTAAIAPHTLTQSTRIRTPTELRLHLEHWLSNNSVLLNNSKRLVAWQACAGQAVEYANTFNTTAALSYFQDTIRAAQHKPPRFDPECGSRCLDSYVTHIQPLIKSQYKRPAYQRDQPDSDDQPPSKRRNRSATSATAAATPQQSPGSGSCSRHPNGSHSSADCNVLRQEREDKKAGKAKVKSEKKDGK